MAAHRNVSDSLQGFTHIETTAEELAWSDSQTQWQWIALALIPLWILCGNSLVLLSVWIYRSLRTLSNWVIASLALTDFLLALTVVPPGIYQLVSADFFTEMSTIVYISFSFISTGIKFFISRQILPR